MADEQPIIVIKKKGGHGGHHGGAWKVAYADFVTAMMALFIVLWLMNSTPKETQEEIAGYFNDPKGISTKKGGEGKSKGPEKDSKSEAEKKKDDMAALKNDLMKVIQNMNLLDKLKKQIEISVTEEGLRIELVEDEKGTFFQSGSAKPTPVLEELLKVLAGQLKNVPNNISIEGHTDAAQYATEGSYGNWELSTDRANVARRAMQANGVRANQVSQVRGFADQKLHFPLKPYDPGNRRVSLLVQNLPAKAPAVKTAAGKLPEEKTGEKAKGENAVSSVTPSEPNATPLTPETPTEAKPGASEKKEAPAGGEGTQVATVVPPAAPAAKSAAGLLDRAKHMFGKK